MSGGGREYRRGICTSLFFAGLLGAAASLAGPVLPRCFSLVRVTTESVPRSARCGCSWRSDCCQQDSIGVGVGEALLAPLRCDNCSSTDLSSCNIYLWSWGSTLEHPPFFRLLFSLFFALPVPFGSSHEVYRNWRACRAVMELSSAKDAATLCLFKSKLT